MASTVEKYLLPGLRPGVQDQGLGRVGCDFRGLGGRICSIPSSKLPVLCWPSLLSLGLQMHQPNLGLDVHMTFTL